MEIQPTCQPITVLFNSNVLLRHARSINRPGDLLDEQNEEDSGFAVDGDLGVLDELTDKPGTKRGVHLCSATAPFTLIFLVGVLQIARRVFERLAKHAGFKATHWEKTIEISADSVQTLEVY